MASEDSGQDNYSNSYLERPPSREELINQYMTGSYSMSRADAERIADMSIQAGQPWGLTPMAAGTLPDRGSEYLGLLHKYDPNRGYDTGFVANTLGQWYSPLLLAGAGLAAGGAAAGAGAGEAGAAGTLGGSAPYIGAGGSAAAGATPALLGETALAPALGGAGLAGAIAAPGLMESGALSPTQEAAQFGFESPAGLTDLPIAGTAGAGAGGVAAGSALSRIIDGTASTADWVQVLGTAGAGALGAYGAGRESDQLSNLRQQMQAERAPFLGAATGWLNDPNSFMQGPGQAAMKGTLAGLSANFGNPIGSGAALGLANDSAMRNWLNAINTTGSLGLSGQGIQADLGARSAGARGDIYGNIAGAASDILNPQRFRLSDYLI